MDIYLGFAKRDLDSGYKAGELVLVQAHEPKGGGIRCSAGTRAGL